MSRLVELPAESPAPPIPRTRPVKHEAWNFTLLALHQVLLRMGWIFKTESIVIPIFLRLIGGSPAMLGWLPVFNRMGFSIPPLLYARQLKLAPLKRRMVTVTTLAMAAPFAALSALWFSGRWRVGQDAAPWMPYLFLALYAVFFAITGMNQLGMHTLQGKLIRYNLRGRLFTVAVMVGAPLAVASAWLLLPGWLSSADGGFGWVFGFTAASFFLAGLSVAFAKESPDDYQAPPTSPIEKFREARATLLHDPRARPVAVLSMLVASNFMLFPHYQSLYPLAPGETILANLPRMMLWVCAQNAATAAFSLVAGPVADRLGNRAALRLATLGLATGPLVAILLAQLGPQAAKQWFWLVFLPLGFMPVTVKLLINYTLEAAPDDDHPRYVAAIGLCFAAPVVVGAPLVGLAVGAAGAAPVFAVGLVVLLLAFGQSLRLPEPRHG